MRERKRFDIESIKEHEQNYSKQVFSHSPSVNLSVMQPEPVKEYPLNIFREKVILENKL